MLLVQGDRAKDTAYDVPLALFPAPRVDIIEADLSTVDDFRMVLSRAFDLANELRVLVKLHSLSSRSAFKPSSNVQWNNS